ncbi:MAG: DJ-1/PfpI family protein [Lentisphaeria bacterium]|nr:DJ-1/PfpI family protein [Lentisphaeria bacterium]
MKKILVILAEGFEEIEAVSVADIMKRAGFDVTLAGLDTLTVRGAHDMPISADVLLKEVSYIPFDAVYLPGGLPGATNLLASETVGEILKAAAARGSVVAAICAAPIVLAKHGLLTDKTFTMYPGFDSYLNGLVPETTPAERCGNVVTGKGPGAVFAFSAKLAEALGTDLTDLYSGMFVNL